MVINQIALSQLEDELRFDSEYYTPNNMLLEKEIGAFPTLLLGSIAGVTDGQHGYFKLDEGSEIRQITAKCIKGGLVDKSNADRLSAVTHFANLRSSLAPNDVLVTTAGTIGDIGLVTDDIPPANIDQDIGRITVYGPSISPLFIWAFLQTKFGRFQMERFTTGQVQTHLSLKKMKKLRLPLVSKHKEVEDIVADYLNAKNIAKKAYKSAQQLLEAELGLDKLIFKKPVGYMALASDVAASRRTDAEYYNPATREIVKKVMTLQHTTIGESFHIQGGFPWDSKRFLADNSGEPVVRIRNVKPNHIAPEELTSVERSYAEAVGASKARMGDVVVGMDGIKYFYASLIEGDCLVNQRVCHLSPSLFKTISPEYAVFMINSVVGQAQLMRDMTVATTVGHITNRDIAKLVVPTISRSFHDEVTALIRRSINMEEESKRLLSQAKARVEQCIEEAARA